MLFVIENYFNFKDYPRPKHSWEETIIYELHIKAFTQSSNEEESCFKKFLKKIPYLKKTWYNNY